MTIDAAKSFPRNPSDVPGKQRYLARPPGLTPSAGSSDFMHGLSYRRGIARDKRERCEALGWAAFEWVFRTQPSLHELACALEALPNLARVVDEADALEAREWMSRLADHPGTYEAPLPHQEVINEITSVTVCIADRALQALFDWDDERRKTDGPPV